MKRWTEKLKQCILCFQTQLADPNLVAICVRYYRLVSRWLVVTANPPPEGLPLPDKVPRLFAALPEFVMNDVAEFLKFVTHLAPQVQEHSEQTLATLRQCHPIRGASHIHKPMCPACCPCHLPRRLSKRW